MFRLDAAPLPWERLPNGLLRAFITLGNPNQDLKYYSLSKGKVVGRTERITDSELQREDSLRTAFGAPVTLGHPKEKRYNGNKEGLMIGSAMQEFRVDDGSVVLAATITDQRGDRLIKETAEKYDGLLPEISPGYSVGSLQRADSGDIWYQVGRQYDHFALLYPKAGRGGQNVPLRLDSIDAIAEDLTTDGNRNYWHIDTSQLDTPAEKPPKKEKKDKSPMVMITLGKRTFQIDSTEGDALIAAVGEIEKERDSALELAQETEAKLATVEGEKNELTDKVTAANTTLETEKGRADALDVKVKELEGTRLDSDAIASDRKDSIEAMMLVLPTLRADNKDFEPDFSWGPNDWRKAYLQAKKPDLQLDDASDERIDAMWEVLKPEKAEVRNDSTDMFKQVLNMQSKDSHNDAADTAAEKRAEARQARIAANGMKSTGAA